MTGGKGTARCAAVLYGISLRKKDTTTVSMPPFLTAKNLILQSNLACGKLESLINRGKKMAYSIDVAAARALATKTHEGQTDKAGLPYITHRP